MDKRERKSRLKDIIKMVDKCIVDTEKHDKALMIETQEKIEDLHWYFEQNCIVPDSFDPEEMMKEILVDYFNHDTQIVRIRKNIEFLADDICDHMKEMEEGSNREDWEEFYDHLTYLSGFLYIEENEINNIEEFMKNINELKNGLQDLI